MNYHQTRNNALRFALLSLFMVSATFASPKVQAITTAQIQAQYRNHVARCNKSPAVVDRVACRKSAFGALQDARSGKLDMSQHDFERNALLRCDAQAASDRADCIARMRGEGTSQGSVQSGAIIRERVTTVPAAKSTGR